MTYSWDRPAYAGTRVLLLINDLDVRVLTVSGELLRHLILDPTKDYQPRRQPQNARSS